MGQEDQPPTYYVSQQSKDYVNVGDELPVPPEASAQPQPVYTQVQVQQAQPYAYPPPQPQMRTPQQPQTVYVQQPAPAPVNYVYLAPGQAPPPGAQVVFMAQPPTVMQSYQPAPAAPNVVYMNHPVRANKGSHYGLCIAAMVLFIVTYSAGIYPCGIISIAMSLHLVNVKVIPDKRRAAVIAFSVLELVGWVFVPAFSWYTTCEEVESDEEYWDGTAYRYRTVWVEVCFWSGWIAIVVWWVFGIAFGIPRVIYTFRARNNVAPNCSPSATGVQMQTMVTGPQTFVAGV